MSRSLPVPKFRLPGRREQPPDIVEDHDQQDYFVEMTLTEHLLELRSRIFKICVSLVGAFIIGLVLAPSALGIVLRTANIERFDVMDATEPITDYFKIALYIAFVLALPMIAYQAFGFISPGLTRKEKRLLYSSLPFSVVLFLLGSSFAFFLAIPRAFQFLSNFMSDTFDYSPRFSSIGSFYIQVTIGMGLSFQLPIVMYLLVRLGIVTPTRLRNFRRYAFVLVLIAAAIITPTPDPFNMLFVAMPIYALYEIGLLFSRLAARRGTLRTLD